MLNADIGKPTGPDSCEGEEGFFLTSHPFLQISRLDQRSALGLRLWLFATKSHSGPLNVARLQPVVAAEPYGRHGVEPSVAVQTR